MIPYNTITAWGTHHPWPTREQVEQDLLLSRAICEIYCDEILGKELVFRGGTALHKLLLEKPYRYSEDLDFVRTTAGGIAPIIGRLSDMGREMGFIVNSKLSKYPKVLWKYTTETGREQRIKIEINTFERSPALPLAVTNHFVNTDWYEGRARIQIFQNEEIAATKIRALYQRSKGRDLFDLWLMLTQLGINPLIVRQAFEIYRPDGYTAGKAIESLDAKLSNEAFRMDIDNLVASIPAAYDIEEAGQMIKDMLLVREEEKEGD
jgi:predicted nucleotidyltransferase component of viral defense system